MAAALGLAWGRRGAGGRDWGCLKSMSCGMHAMPPCGGCSCAAKWLCLIGDEWVQSSPVEDAADIMEPTELSEGLFSPATVADGLAG